jgi:hypothetical protein
MAALYVCCCEKKTPLHDCDAGRTGRCPGCQRSITIPPAAVIEAHDGLTVGIDELPKLGPWRPGQVMGFR